MFLCPKCRTGLLKAMGPLGVLWTCPTCGGRTAGVAQLRRAVPPDTVNTLWQLARAAERPRGRPCPGCGKPMAEVPLPAESGGRPLDVCMRCLLVWFDPGEYEALPQGEPAEAVPVKRRLPQAAREKLALMELDAIRERADDVALPDGGWQKIVAFLGFPVEYNDRPLACLPWLTWLLSAVVAAVSGWAFFDLKTVVQAFGLIPAQFERLGGLTLLTSFFLHGGILHLLGNLYFLLVFGDNVEDDLGKGRFLLLLLSAILVGNALHILGDPRADMPCIGASGGISGIITYYALRFPHAKLGMLLRFGFLFRWVRLSAMTMLALWVGLQVIGAWLQVSGFSNVSSLAHLGGAAAGFFVWLARRGK